MHRLSAMLILGLVIPSVSMAESKPDTKDAIDQNVDAINAYFGKGVSVDENAVVMIYKAFGPHPEKANIPDEFFQKLGIPVPPENGDYFQPFDYTEERRDQFNTALEKVWSRKDCPAVVKWLEANEKPLDVIIEGIKRPKWYSPIVRWKDDSGRKQSLLMTLLPASQQIRSIARLLTAQAHLAIHEKRYDDAWSAILNCHRLGRMQSKGPTLIDFLVGTAIVSIADSVQKTFLEQTDLDYEMLTAMRKQWRELPTFGTPTLQVGITEKFMLLDVLDSLQDGHFELLGELSADGTRKDLNPAQKVALSLVDWNIAKAHAVEAHEEVSKLLKIEDYQTRTKNLEMWNLKIANKGNAQLPTILDSFIKSGSIRGTIDDVVADAVLSQLMPAIGQVDAARCRAVTRLQNTDVFFGLEMHRAKTGEYPNRLEQLVPSVLASKPIDPFSGSDLKYTRTKDGFLMYSVGQNGKDEQGKTYGETKPDAKVSPDDLRIKIGKSWPNKKAG